MCVYDLGKTIVNSIYIDQTKSDLDRIQIALGVAGGLKLLSVNVPDRQISDLRVNLGAS